MHGPPPYCKRKMKVTNWSARMYSAFVGVAILWPEWNAMRSVLFSNAAFAGCFRLQVSGAPGSTVVPSQGSPANLTGILKESNQLAVVAGLQMWESQMRFPSLAFCQASCAGQFTSGAGSLRQQRRSIGFSLGKYSPRHACHLGPVFGDLQGSIAATIKGQDNKGDFLVQH